MLTNRRGGSAQEAKPVASFRQRGKVAQTAIVSSSLGYQYAREIAR